jgi:hypothetical protein
MEGEGFLQLEERLSLVWMAQKGNREVSKVTSISALGNRGGKECLELCEKAVMPSRWKPFSQYELIGFHPKRQTYM